MALIKCPECDEEISSDVFSCPKCGKTIRKPKRSFFGKIIKFAFILFNIFMILWVVSGMNAVSPQLQGHHAGAAVVGTGIALGMMAGIWVAGDIILGILVLFTRPKGS